MYSPCVWELEKGFGVAETKWLKNDIDSLSFNYPCYLCFHYYGSQNVIVTAAQLITAACNHDVCSVIIFQCAIYQGPLELRMLGSSRSKLKTSLSAFLNVLPAIFHYHFLEI